MSRVSSFAWRYADYTSSFRMVHRWAAKKEKKSRIESRYIDDTSPRSSSFLMSLCPHETIRAFEVPSFFRR